MSYLTIQQAAERLQLPVTTVKTLIKQNRLEATRINAMNVRIKEADLENIKSAPAPKRKPTSGENHWRNKPKAAEKASKPRVKTNGKAPEKEPVAVN